MVMENQEHRVWVALGILSIAASILLAAYGRHGIQVEELQMRWGIAVEYLRFMGLGVVAMVLVRKVWGMAEQSLWSERLLGAGTACFCGMLLAESTWPHASLLSGISWLAPVGGIIMVISWLVFLFEFIYTSNR